MTRGLQASGFGFQASSGFGLLARWSARLALLLLAIASHAHAQPPRTAWPKAPSVEAPRGITPVRVRVLVVELNPMVPGEAQNPPEPGAPSLPLNQAAGWRNPIDLAAGFLDDVTRASGGIVRYDIVDWQVLREFPVKADGFLYTADSYMASRRDPRAHPWHQPDGIDYPRLVARLGLVPRVESGEIDEVWAFGAPYFGMWESTMIGAGAFDINGDPYTNIASRRRFIIMGFSYERGVAEMLEDLCHRTEATLTHVFGGWKVDQLTTTWAKFAANEKQSGTAAVGTCHYPPNGERDYDYANPRLIVSTADDWLHYPDLQERSRRFNCEEWAEPHLKADGKPDYHRNYLRWWFTHLPKASGVAPDGRLQNWWEYLFNYAANH